MVPLRSEEKPVTFPYATISIIALCSVLFVVQSMGYAPITGFVPVDFFHALLHPGFETARVALYCIMAFFTHAGIGHLISNVWYLWLFGGLVEERLGSMRFCRLYLVCGISSMLIQAVATPLSQVPVVGASGAIAGVMGLGLIFRPMARMLVWVPPLFLLKVPSFIFLIPWFFIQYVSARGNTGAPVAFWAHVGGFIVGVIIGFRIHSRVKKNPSRKKR